MTWIIRSGRHGVRDGVIGAVLGVRRPGLAAPAAARKPGRARGVHRRFTRSGSGHVGRRTPTVTPRLAVERASLAWNDLRCPPSAPALLRSRSSPSPNADPFRDDVDHELRGVRTAKAYRR